MMILRKNNAELYFESESSGSIKWTNDLTAAERFTEEDAKSEYQRLKEQGCDVDGVVLEDPDHT